MHRHSLCCVLHVRITLRSRLLLVVLVPVAFQVLVVLVGKPLSELTGRSSALSCTRRQELRHENIEAVDLPLRILGSNAILILVVPSLPEMLLVLVLAVHLRVLEPDIRLALRIKITATAGLGNLGRRTYNPWDGQHAGTGSPSSSSDNQVELGLRRHLLEGLAVLQKRVPSLFSQARQTRESPVLVGFIQSRI